MTCIDTSTWSRCLDLTSMGDAEFEGTGQPTTSNMSNKKKELLSTAMKRTSEWFALLLILILINVFNLC